MLTEQELVGMRCTSESAMPAECVVTREGEPTFDSATGAYEAEPVAVWSGPCRLRPVTTQGMTAPVGGLHETMSRSIVTVPHHVDHVHVDDFLTITAGSDSGLIGRPQRVIDVYWSEWSIDRRLLVEDLLQPRPTGGD